MSISGFGLDTALSGLTANQRALEVTGHNVSNLNTAGYSRQSVVMASAQTRTLGSWRVEMGVDIHEIRQIRHLFNDNIYRSESNNLGYWEARSKAIADVEAILGEPMTAGIQSALNNFWDAWQELSKSPESLTTRALLKQRSESLVEHLNHVGTQLNKLQADLNNEIKTRIDEVNDITESIAKLNVKIMSAEAAGNAPNDYYDERNSLVDRLSKLVKAETWVGQDGNMDILVGGYFLVSKGVQTKIYAAPNEDLSHFYTPKLVGADVAIDVGQGIIKGLLEARGEVDGSKGKFDNGTPNTTADITIAVDTANITPGYLDNIRNYVDKIASDLKARGLNYNLRLLTFGSGTITNTNFGQDAAALSAAIPTTPGTDAGYDIGDIISSVTSAGTFIDDANRYLMVFTGESPNGDGNMATDTQISSWLQSLKRNGITTSVITDSDYFVDGDAGEKGWGILTGQTGGKLYDIESADYSQLMSTISTDISDDVNMKISSVSDDLNIISTVKKQLNALINIMAREVNRLHSTGKTLKGEDGGLFFEPIDPDRPMELGNIRISAALKDVNNIAASTIDANGDNTLALAIANLRNANLMTGNKKILSLDTYYQNLLLDVANKGYEADTMVTSYQKLVEQADNIRQTVMGVSLDEEMTNMIKFKYGYNANSKVIDAINQMLETVINRLGHGG